MARSIGKINAVCPIEQSKNENINRRVQSTSCKKHKVFQIIGCVLYLELIHRFFQ